MKYITVYRFEMVYNGTSFIKQPSIPNYRMIGENTTIPRISVCTTIPACIQALNLPDYQFKKLNDKPGRKYVTDNDKTVDLNIRRKPIKIYLYAYDATIDELSYPVDVPDSWITGELWLTKPTDFVYVDTYYVRVCMHIPNSCYSRYTVTKEGYEEAIDKICGDIIYGDQDSFTFLARNPLREDMALDVAGNNGGLDYYMKHGTNWK